jgi:hypothetical protein
VEKAEVSVEMEKPNYDAHPYLNPNLSIHDPATFRALYRQFLRICKDDDTYNSFLNKMLRTGGKEESLGGNLKQAETYLAEVEPYLHGLLDLIPQAARTGLLPLKEIEECNDVRRLMSHIFQREDLRRGFEAQRKLYLAKLFFDTDQTWTIQRGPIHRRYFENLLGEDLFRYVVDERVVEICCNLGSDGVSVDYTLGRSGSAQECWTFHVYELEIPHDGTKKRINVFFYSVRFKREVIAYQYQRGQDHYQLKPVEIWGELRTRRSGSIVSKMIRKGESNPLRIEDILGAMFIVQDLEEVETLKEVLMDLFCGPLRFRNVTDTLSPGGNQTGANPYSASGYQVYKAEIDLLYPGNDDEKHPPYFFTVELQIYTLESYLRTIHTDHYASHQQFKKRQFLLGLLPYFFPPAVYGDEPLRSGLEADARAV